jgi:GxxExxY protein
MLIYERETYAILGACFEVYKDKGCGFLEAVYQECLRIELAHREIPFEAEVALPLMYRGQPLQTSYRADFICYGKIILELKAASAILDEHRAQLLNYLAATGYELGMLINFGHHPKLEHERLANTRARHLAIL